MGRASFVVVLLVSMAGCRTRPLFSGEPPVIVVNFGDAGVVDQATPIGCGDGVIEDGEECDDGNQDNHDGCLNTCMLARCGDGIVRAGVEACDDGNTDDTDGCTSKCALPTCGDGIVQADEGCDDGNQDDTDACLSTCLPAFCGDGFVEKGVEACDDGNLDNTDACTTSCAPARCGDGFTEKNSAEQCDDGNLIDNDFCDNHCKLPVCGDGKLAGNEVCDDGNTDNTDTCTTQCQLARCGDGFVEAGVEVCDDGNPDNTDGCTTKCQPARCGDGFVHAGFEQCDDGNMIDNDGCDNNCNLPVCGDGKVGGNEQCDLGMMNGNRPAFLITQASGLAIATNPLVEPKTSAQFYDYYSASSHTGFEAAGESRAYLYVDADTGRLSLILTHGIDETGSTGTDQPVSEVTMQITNLPLGFTIDLSDDAGEFKATGPMTAAGDWHFNRNSDGGILGGLPFPGVWSINVAATFTMGVNTWGFVRDDLTRIPLDKSEPITIQAFDSSSACRTDCTTPRCGDGILDGGEICDDGNNKPHDGCAADCKSLNN